MGRGDSGLTAATPGLGTGLANRRTCMSPFPTSTLRRLPGRRVRHAPATAAAALAALLALLAVAATAGDESDSLETEPDTTDIAASITLPPPGEHEVLPAPERPVRPGEKLRFSVQWKFMHAGKAWLEVPDAVDWNGRPALTLVARAESNAFISTFYKVRNRIESTWDRDGHFSWRYAENRREGGYRANNEIVFDYGLNEARYKDGRTFPIPDHCQDALSSFYYARTQPLPIGGSVVFDYHASRKSLPLEVRVLGRERVKVPAGTFDCVVLEPMLKAGGIFKNKGRLLIWLTADDRRIPVLMRSKVTIGSIDVILQEIKGGA